MLKLLILLPSLLFLITQDTNTYCGCHDYPAQTLIAIACNDHYTNKLFNLTPTAILYCMNPIFLVYNRDKFNFSLNFNPLQTENVCFKEKKSGSLSHFRKKKTCKHFQSCHHHEQTKLCCVRVCTSSRTINYFES